MNYYMGIPMFSYWGGCGARNPFTPFGSSAAYTRATQRAVSLTAGAWPYGWVGYSNGQNSYNFIDSNEFSYGEAVEINRMIHNPNYIPHVYVPPTQSTYIDTEQQKLAGQQDAYRAILKAKFLSLGDNLNSVINQAQQALATQNLSDEQKEKIQEFINQANDLLKKREQLAQKSQNMQVLDALREISALQREYYTLRDNIKAFSSGMSVNNGNSPVDGNNNDDNVNNNDVEPVDIPQPIGEDEEITPEQLKTKYEEEMKPAIDELLNNPDLSKAQKKAIQEKQKELEKAIQEGKPIEDLRKIYNELSELANGTQNTVLTDNLKEKTEELKDKFDEIKDNENLTDDEKKAIQDKQAELDKAIQEGKSPEEIQEKVNELSELVDKANSKIDYFENVKPKAEEVLSCSDISDEEKKAIQDKQKEIEKAIERGKSADTINKLKEELVGLIDAAKAKIDTNNNQTEQQTQQEEINKITELSTEINKWLNDFSGYLTPKDKKAILDKIEELNKMKESGNIPSAEELNKFRTDLQNKFNSLKQRILKLSEESRVIAEKIYEAANGTDFHFVNPFGGNEYTEKEKILIENVKKLNENNIAIFLKKWEDNFRGSLKDTCLIETIRGEFLEYEGAKIEAELTLYIVNLIEKWAKNNDVFNEKVKDKIAKIRSEVRSNSGGSRDSSLYNWSEVYNEFNKLLMEIGVKPKDASVI